MLKYKKPEAKIILFDNSDVITASAHDLDWTNCNASVDYAYCVDLGDSQKANKCRNEGLSCSLESKYECIALWWLAEDRCDAEGSLNFFNAQPVDPIQFEDEEENW